MQLTGNRSRPVPSTCSVSGVSSIKCTDDLTQVDRTLPFPRAEREGSSSQEQEMHLFKKCL